MTLHARDSLLSPVPKSQEDRKQTPVGAEEEDGPGEHSGQLG